MGRKTSDSLPLGFLPGRVNYIISNTVSEDALWKPSLESAISSAQTNHSHKEIFIIGGQSIYEAALKLPKVDQVILTRHHYKATQADTYFPDLGSKWSLKKTIPYYASIDNQAVYTEIEIYEPNYSSY